MSSQKRRFVKFLKELYEDDFQYYLEKFEQYHEWLVEENQKINLISRKMDTEDYWTLHYLDSILPVGFLDFYEKKILDFGTGGGLPGIPLQILHPDSEITFLDSKQKKINSISQGVTSLGIENCDFIASRIEELPKALNETFDVIVCRSVRILPTFKDKLLSLLGEGGRLILYKGRNLDDVDQFEDFEIHDVSIPEIGERNVIEVVKLTF